MAHSHEGRITDSTEKKFDLAKIPAGLQLIINLEEGTPLWALVANPASGHCLVRPAHGNTTATPYGDDLYILGSKPFREGAQPRVTPAADVDLDIEWGALTYGNEPVIRTERDGQAFIIYLGTRIDSVATEAANFTFGWA